VRVLAVVDSLTLGGAESLLATLARAASPAGLDLQVVTIGSPRDQRSLLLPMLRDAGLEPRFLSIPRLADPRAIPRLALAIRASGCDVVHAHLEYAATLVPPAARLVGRQAVCTFHHMAQPLPGKEAVKERLAVAVANRSRGVIFVSDASLGSFAARYRRNDATWVVVRNGVDLERFRPEPAALPAELAVPPGVPVATIVAALRAPKGHRTVIDAWPLVREQVPEARLLLVGSGGEEPGLRRRAAVLGLGDAVVFAGIRTDVDVLLRASELALLPSESEALPTSLMEAAACGKPVVATAVGGVPEVVRAGETGVLVAPGDVGAFARAIVDLLTQPSRRDAMGTAARRLAEERFDMHTWVGLLGRVYRGAARGVPAVTALAA
jgi:glycosyltransferase involved in cell wall biosynthesis